MTENEFVPILVSAPGKVILHGEHAVVHGKRALACSLNLRTFMLVNKLENGLICLHLPDVGILREWTVDSVRGICDNLQELGDSANCSPSANALRLIANFANLDHVTQNTKELAVIAFLYLFTMMVPANRLSGLHFLVSSRLPTGAGLGSSAAFAVCLSASLLSLSNAIQDPGHKAFNTWSESDQKIINDWAFVVEKIIHGNPSGVDNSISTYGGILKYQNKQLEPLNLKHQLHVLITNTKVPRSTKQMVANVTDKLKKYPSIIQPVLDAIEALAVKCQEQITSDNDLDNMVLKELVQINQHLLCVLGVNHPSLEKICEITATRGLVSKLTGAGGGGCAFTLLTRDVSDALVAEVKGALEAEGFECWKTVVGGPGVGLHHGKPDDSFELPPALTDTGLYGVSSSHPVRPLARQAL